MNSHTTCTYCKKNIIGTDAIINPAAIGFCDQNCLSHWFVKKYKIAKKSDDNNQWGGRE